MYAPPSIIISSWFVSGGKFVGEFSISPCSPATLFAAANVCFLFDSNDAQIIDLRFYLPPLSKNQFRKGYFSFETYWEFNNSAEYQEVFKDSVKITDFDPLTIYKIVNSTIGDENIYLDGNTEKPVKYSNTIKINGSDVDITDKEEYLVTIPDEIDEVYLPSGVLADVGV